MGERWRLLEDPPAPGDWNMAVDAALLESAETGLTGPVLRLYGWDRPTLSIGYLQKIKGAIDTDYLKRNNIPLVRRPTGGRALIHDDEVTYSVAIPSTSRFYGPLNRIYAMVSAALRSALKDCGVNLDSGKAESRVRGGACCFATRTRFEISVKGRKIAGGAQRRLKSSALQHGSIALTMDKERFLSCFIWRDNAARREAGRLIGCLNDGFITPVSADKARGAVVKAFERLYRVEFIREGLTYSERERADSIASGQKSEMVKR